MEHDQSRPGPVPGEAACGGAADGAAPLIQQMGPTLTILKRAYEAELGMGPLNAWLLTLLLQHDGITQNELVGIVQVDPSMITRTVKEMERRGWIRRERDSADNRLMRVSLTDRGRAQTDGLTARFAAIERQLTRNLTDRQLRDLRAALDILAETARAQLGKATTA